MGINLWKERRGVDSRKGSKTGEGKTARGEKRPMKGGGENCGRSNYGESAMFGVVWIKPL